MAKPRILEKVARESNTTVKELVLSTFNKHNNVKATAAALGVTRQAIYYVLGKHNIKSVTTTRLMEA
ncbi:MAG: hypothetical protein KF716_15010 [Anaerolineae bacterium]|nr:hypothetical protein [Anaerolineae bacterium]